MAKKKLLIYAHYYIPDTASTGQILRELAEGMLDKFDITVICVVPSYLGTIEDKYKTQKYYEEEISSFRISCNNDDVTVCRLWRKGIFRRKGCIG